MAFTLSKAADDDLHNMWDYTLDNWGERQADQYTGNLYVRFEWLSENPQLGIERDEIKGGYRSWFEGKHVIFYREVNQAIEIIGILGQNEDVIQHLSVE